ncbi:bone morphogenetic protein receptor type-2-like [Pollicipes pollicipes]|uniref:bone morphogenetic protein receptor type-2-like n=1 Tax=Pollicipes pollicipes TaxID=41117 RepID=UPI001885A0F8|nr:bone morphogenetic protein receptor type-2-like [Pollicipes pollicipes]
MKLTIQCKFLFVVGWAARPAAGAVAEGVLCAYHAQSAGPTYYDQYEQDGAPLGKIVDDGAHMRCFSDASYCFSLWHDVAGGDNTSQRAFIVQGCINIAQPQAQCDQPSCTAHGESSRGNNTHFCCCHGNLCNVQVTYVPLPAVAATPDTSAAPQLDTPSTVAVVCGSLVCVLLVLGRGRYGSVREGLLYGEDVAVKIFPAWYRHYFMSERDIYSLPWMDHPSLAHLYGADERVTEAGTEYLLVLSHVPQGTVHDFLCQNTLQFQQMCRMAMTAR